MASKLLLIARENVVTLGMALQSVQGRRLGHSAGALSPALGPEQATHMTVLNIFFYLLHYVTVSSNLVCLLVSFHYYDR